MMMIIIVTIIINFRNIFKIARNNKKDEYVEFDHITHEPSRLTHDINCILLLYYKFQLPKYNTVLATQDL
jgi:hypothetical protein